MVKATTLEDTTLFGSITLKAKNVLNTNVEDLITSSSGEYEIYNPLNKIGINTITVRTSVELITLQIGEFDFEVDYCNERNEFLITFSINTNVSTNVINNGELQPVALVVYGSVPISEQESIQYSEINSLDYIVVQEVDGKELFINTSIECDIVNFEFEEEY